MLRLKIILQSKLFLFLSFLFLIFYCFITTKVIKYSSVYELGQKTIEAKIISYNIDGDKLSLKLQAQEKLVATYYLSSALEKENLSQDLKIGQTLLIEGEITNPKNNTIPNTFNYSKYLYNQKIYRHLTIKKLTIKANPSSLIAKIKNAFYQRMNNISSSDYLKAFILGDKTAISSKIYNSYSINGVTHLFAISGMHISFLVSFLTKTFKRFSIKENIINLIIALFLLFYLFLIGFSASVVRSSLLYLFLLLNKKLNIGLNTLNILYLLFFILLLINPFYIYDLGFIYSFLTSFGLILFSSKIKGNYLKKMLLVSSIAFLFSLPVSLANFYEFNLLTIFNNLIIVPLVSLILFPLSLLTFLFPFLSNILNIGFNILEFISLNLAKIKIMIVVPKINFFFLLLYYFFVYLIYKKNYKYCLAIFFLIFSFKIIPYLDSKEYVYFLDVGQGDSSLIISAHRQNITLIDTGGKIKYNQEPWQIRNKEYDMMANIITFLHSLGINKLDLLILSHGDYDHLGESFNLINNFNVQKVMFNQGALNDIEQELIEVLANKKIPYYNDFSKLKIKNNIFYFLPTKIYDNENDNSNIVYFKLKNFKFLFMGDASIKVENALLEKYNLTNIDVLKVGHHGSNTSSSKNFIAQVNPKYAIISVGQNNRYGHPNQDVLENLASSNIYRTDQFGTIKFTIKSKQLKIQYFKP